MRSHLADHDDGPGDRPVIVLADHDDPDLGPASKSLAEDGIPVIWAELARPAEHYDVEADLDRVVLRAGAKRIDDSTIAAAPLVLYRRWRLSPPAPPVSLSLEGDPEKFGEREWCASIQHALWHWHRWGNSPWANPPGAISNRLGLYSLARGSGLPLPETHLSTRLPPSMSSLVAKAVADNEWIGGDFYFRATELSGEPSGHRSPCPSLLQELIRPDLEVRAVYCFGVIGAVSLQRTSTDGPLDIRYDPDVTRAPYELPEDLREAAARFAAMSTLNMFTMDLLVKGREHWVVDITPSGTVGSVDDESGCLSGALSRGIRRRVDAALV